MFLCGVAPALVLLAGVLVLPRSPRWLALAGRDEEAREVLAAIREEEVDEELAEIQGSFEHVQAGWHELWAPLARNALLVGLGLGIFQQFIGINTVIYYAPTILQFTPGSSRRRSRSWPRWASVRSTSE
jgi:MFS family permease